MWDYLTVLNPLVCCYKTQNCGFREINRSPLSPFPSRFHPGRRRPRHGETLRQRFLPDNDIPIRGPQPQLQEHVQAEATAAEVARGCGQHPQQPGLAQQPDDHPGDYRKAEEETHLNRD